MVRIHMQKYQLLINKRESTGLKYCKGPKALIEYSNYMNTIHKNIEEYNTDKERKMYMYLMIQLSICLAKKNLTQQ